MLLINGAAQDFLSVSDRAIQFGDGCFTTARIMNGIVYMLDAHLQRLQKTCSALFIPFVDWEILCAEMVKIAQEQSEGVLKVIISRGIGGGYGYGTKNCSRPTRILFSTSYPTNYARWHRDGIVLTLSPIRLSCNHAFAGLKHLNRLEQVLIYTHIEYTGADEALVLDTEGYITECCTANLFWRYGKMVFTPKLDQAGVKGIMRQFYLKQLTRSNFHVVKVKEKIDVLQDAEEVIICNSLLPVVSVRAYKNYCWGKGELYHFLARLCS